MSQKRRSIIVDKNSLEIRLFKFVCKMFKIALNTFLLFIMIGYNLKANSVYYARNIPHGENVDSELMMILENWFYIYFPVSENYGTNDIRDGGFFFSKYDKYGKPKESIDYKSNRSFVYYDRDDINEYTIDTSGKIVSVTNRETNKEVYNYKYGKYDPDKEKEILKKIRALIKPILDKNEKPLINLQWLYNIKYYNYFY